MLKSILSYAVAAGLAFSVLGAPLAARADDLETIKAAGEFKFANSGAYPPFSFVDDSNQTVGFDVDIGNEIAKRLGVKGAGVSTAWDGIIAGLLAGKYDTIIGSMTITPEREKAVDFVGPLLQVGARRLRFGRVRDQVDRRSQGQDDRRDARRNPREMGTRARRLGNPHL
jgi:polar amino acid transport system substrate-binding protein